MMKHRRPVSGVNTIVTAELNMAASAGQKCLGRTLWGGHMGTRGVPGKTIFSGCWVPGSQHICFLATNRSHMALVTQGHEFGCAGRYVDAVSRGMKMSGMACFLGNMCNI